MNGLAVGVAIATIGMPILFGLAVYLNERNREVRNRYNRRRAYYKGKVEYSHEARDGSFSLRRVTAY